MLFDGMKIDLCLD